MSLNEDFRSLAEMQYSLVSRRQARSLGATRSGLQSRLLGPDWDAPTPRVLRLVGAPRTVRQHLMLAVLDAGPGAVVSHSSAAALWQLPGFSFTTVEVSRPRHRSTCATAGARPHHPRLLPASHVTDRHHIPVTTLARTMFDLAGRLHPARLERLIDTVVSRSPSALMALHALLPELAAAGRSGIAAMRVLLDSRPEGYVATASGLEARFASILAEAGEAPMERQVDVGGHEWVGRVDFLDRMLRLIVEIDSDVHHTSPLDRAHDRRRDRQLQSAGWREVVRVTEDEVWRHPRVALERVQDARRRARKALVSQTGGNPFVSDTGTVEAKGMAG